MQSAILNIHNTDRNQIASGQVSPYSAATNMGTLTWDPALAASCVPNVQQCAEVHDRDGNVAFNFKKGGHY